MRGTTATAIENIDSDITKKLATLELEANKHVVSIDGKKVKNNTSLLEAIGTALRCLQSVDITQSIERSKCKLLLKGGVSLAIILDKKLFQDKLNTQNELSSGETKFVKQRLSTVLRR